MDRLTDDERRLLDQYRVLPDDWKRTIRTAAQVAGELEGPRMRMVEVPAQEPAGVRAWLGVLADREPRVHPTVGLGEALRWEAPGVTAAVAVDGALVHFVAFPLEDCAPYDPRRTRLRAASRRRRKPTEWPPPPRRR